MAIEQFELLKKSAVTQIQSDLEDAVAASASAAATSASNALTSENNAALSESNAGASETSAASSASSASSSATAASTSANSFTNTHPEVTYVNRVGLDSGTIKDLEELTNLYLNDLEIDKYSVFKWSGYSGVKKRTSGSNNYVAKIYDNTTNNNDAVQATEANQPFYAGIIAPNAVGRIKNIVDNKVLTHPTINLSSLTTSSFSVTTVLKPYFQNVGTSANKGKFTSGTLELYVTNTGVIQLYSGGTGTIQIPSTTLDTRKTGTVIVTWSADVNGIYIWINGVKCSYTGSYQPFSATLTGLLQSSDDDTFAGEIYHHQIFNKALSAIEIQNHHAHLKSIYPEVEGMPIGNQYWATSSQEKVTTVDGTVIGEYQDSTNTTRNVSSCVNGTYSAFSGASASGFSAASNGSGTQYAGTADEIPMTANKYIKVTFSLALNSGTLPSVNLYSALNGTSRSTALTATAGSNTMYFRMNSDDTGVLQFFNTSTASDFVVSSLVVATVGWIDAQNLYDGIYAQTSGTAAVKDLAATKAAAMWCYYNNDVLNGAIYGKLYNWWGAKLWSFYPVRGYRVPTLADFTQLSTYLGGDSVSGGKMKHNGTSYWASPNTGATNESGMTLLPMGARDGGTGAFALITTGARVWSATDSSTVSAYRLGTSSTDAATTLTAIVKTNGYTLRLMRNEPVGNSVEAISSDRITSDIASTAKQIPFKFGYTVRQIRVTADTALTNIEAKLHNVAGTAIATLMTGKSVSAGETMTFKIVADHTAMLQDGTVRVTATGNTSVSIGCEVVVLAEKAALI